MEQIKRIEWVDTIKFICIAFVVLSHLEMQSSFWRTLYSPIFLTSFFFVAGYVYKSGRKFSDLFYRKFRQLFIPWLIFSSFNLLLSQVVSFNEHNSFINEMMWNFLQIRGEGDGIWFVACLFVTFIPFYFFIEWYERELMSGGGTILAVSMAFALSLASRIYTNIMPLDILPWESASLPWHLEYIFQAMFYMVLGYAFKRCCEGYFNERNNIWTRSVVCIVYLILVYVPRFCAVQMSLTANMAYSYLSEIIGIVCIVAIAKGIKSNWFISYVGQNTLICFALHGKVYSILQMAMKQLIPSIYESILNNALLSSTVAVVLTVVVLVILIVPICIINRWFPCIIGRK